MASYFTNRGIDLILDSFFRATNSPTAFKVMLITGATAPTVDTSTTSGLTEIAAGNGYTAGGVSITRDATGFDVITQDDTNNKAYVMMKDAFWTVTGNMPASGSPARWALLLDTAVTPNVIAVIDLGGDRTFTADSPCSIQNFTLGLLN